MASIYFGGAGAGAHLVSQFSTVKTNGDYAELIKVKPVISDTTIVKGVVLFCGFYSVDVYMHAPFYIKNAWHRIGTPYYGNSKFKENESINILNYSNENSSSSFIPDGNNGSFEKYGRELAIKLLNNNVDVTQSFHYTKS